MKTSLNLCLMVSNLAAHTAAAEPGSGNEVLSAFLPHDIPSIRLGTLTLPNGLPMPSGLPIPSNLPIPIALPFTTHFPTPRGFHRQTRRQLFGITENGVTTTTDCQPLTFIFARGTGELGNMGTVVGPPVASALSSLTGGKVAIQGVNYDASIVGDATAGADGGPTMAKYVTQALQQCPNTKVVLGGYSEGAMVVHNAANSLSEGQVAAAVLFGDPFKMFGVGKLSASQVKEFCALGDPVCENGFNVLAHVSYGADAKTAAQFLLQAAGLSSS